MKSAKKSVTRNSTPKKQKSKVVKPEFSKWQSFKKRNVEAGKTIREFEDTGIFQIVKISAAVLGFVALIWTLYSIKGDLDFRAEERESFRQDRMSTAWDRLLRPIGGETGKGKQLSYLFRNGENTDGLNLSCEAMTKKIGGCFEPPVLSNLELISQFDNPKHREHFLAGNWNLNNVKIEYAKVQNTNLTAKMAGTEFIDGSFINSDIWAQNISGTTSFEYMNFENVSFRSSQFKFAESLFRNVHFQINKNFEFVDSALVIGEMPTCSKNVAKPKNPKKCPKNILEKFSYCVSMPGKLPFEELTDERISYFDSAGPCFSANNDQLHYKRISYTEAKKLYSEQFN